MELKKITKNDELTEKEKNLINIIRSSNANELRILIREKQPVRVEELKDKVEL